MTFEDMQNVAGEIANALNASGKFRDAAVMHDECKPGEPLPIAFNDGDDDFVIELNSL
jgi:hypothetical protein